MYGMDLGELYASRRWVALLDLIEELPENSRTNSAIANDPETAPVLAARLLEQEKSRGKVEWKPNSSEWTLIHELLAQLLDSFIRANSDKPKSVKGFPRPSTAVAEELVRARRKAAEDATRDLVAELTPWAAG